MSLRPVYSFTRVPLIGKSNTCSARRITGTSVADVYPNCRISTVDKLLYQNPAPLTSALLLPSLTIPSLALSNSLLGVTLVDNVAFTLNE